MTIDDAITRERPALLVIADEPGRSAELRPALEHAGWQVRVLRDLAEDLTVAGCPSLFLLNHDRDLQIAGQIRAMPGDRSAAPIVALRFMAPPDDAPEPGEVDAILPAAAGADALVRGLDSWRPVSLAPTRRIAAMLGAGPIAGMIERLARRLEAASAALDRGTIDQAEAHRLAGLCGTLGFGQAHAAWLDLSQGDETALADVRRTTRLTLAAIARGI